MGDIRKWFMKSHDKGNGDASKPAKPTSGLSEKPSSAKLQPDKSVEETQGSASRRKTSKYFAAKNQKGENEEQNEELLTKRKTQEDSENLEKSKPSSKKIRKVDVDDDDDLVFSTSRKDLVGTTPNKKLRSGSGKGIPQKPMNVEESDEDEDKNTELQTKKSGGRGQGGRGSSAAPAGGRGRGSGRGGFMNFGERKDPPHKGEKEVPAGAAECLAGLTFVISGTLDSLEREEAESLIKRHGGRVTGSVSKKTNYLLCDEDIEGRKSSKAKELGTAFLTEDGLFDIIRASNRSKVLSQGKSQKSMDEDIKPLPRKSPQKVELKKGIDNIVGTNVKDKGFTKVTSPALGKSEKTEHATLTWTEKYRPKVPNDIIGNQSLVKQLHDWLTHWKENFLDTGNKKKGKKVNDSGNKKAVLLSGTPGIGKTTSAKLVCQMLGFQAIEVNASDHRGKADAKIGKGIGGSNANSVKELISNVALNVSMDWSKHPKMVLIMDEVDGMSAGDRGGVADLIASIKISKIPIICICNDRYSQKLKSLVNYCLLLSFRKPTKQQMAKRLMQIAKAEGLQVNEIALEELAERVHGDMRMAINQLQYMSLSLSVIKYEDVHQRLLSSAKDEDISPFTAVDKLFSYNSSKLKMDERIGLSMSDPDLVPLLVQENYLNYRSNLVGKDDNGIKRMDCIARAAESIADGDIINVQIRRNRQWQLSQCATLASCIIPAALLHGQRETLEQGERNFNRFGGWLGKNSTMGKNLRLLEDLHVHVLASRESSSGRETIRVEYLSLLLKQLTEPLRALPKDEAVQKVVEFMNDYSISQEDYDTIVELSKFRGHPNPLDGIQPAVKAALTRAYKEGSKTRMVRAADLITLPGIKKAPKKRIAAILEPSEEVLGDGDGDKLEDSEEERSSDTESLDDGSKGEKLQQELETLNSKGTKVQLDLKGKVNSNAKKSAGRGKGGAEASSAKKGGSGRASAPTAKRKR